MLGTKDAMATVAVRDLDAAKKFYDKFKLTMPWFLDPGQVVASRYKVSGFPETFLIDRNGHLIRHFVGAISSQIMGQLDGYIGDQGEGTAGPTQ